MRTTGVCGGNCSRGKDALWRARFASIVFAIALMGLAWQLAFSARPTFTFGNFPKNAAVQSSSPLPAGLILPVGLDNAISLKEVQKGVVVEARIMQEVPLPDRGKIALRALVKGPILAVEKDADGGGVKLTLKFNQVQDRKQTYSMAASLRAIASYLAVRSAQTPPTGADAGTPAGWSNTVQIGGDVRYGDGGIVRNRSKQRVGKGVLGGVLVHVYPNPSLGCEGPVNGDDRLQALWVFSADACGVYEMKGVVISHAGKTPPVGEITLHFEKDDMKLDAGTGILLRVVAQP